MADLDEDPPVNSQSGIDEDHDPGDETQDFLLLASLTSKSSHQIPKRGEKDFERHGTRHQDDLLSASRQAMHDALDYTRIHTPKAHVRGFYYGAEGLKRDDVVPEEWRKGLDNDHVVVVESAKGPHFKSMGKSTLGKKHTSLWLLPEEALYLLERGGLDLWWPTPSSFKGIVDEDSPPDQDDLKGGDEGLPMSLQAAYAMLLGEHGEKGKVSLERFNVYANLRRTGFVVLRAPEWDPLAPHSVQSPAERPSLFTWLFGHLFTGEKVNYPAYGPLVKPGMYRSYDSIYRQIAIIPRYKPSPASSDASQSSEFPYRVIFDLWRPARLPKFAKSNPGIPDMRIAVTSSRTSSVPTLTQMAKLLESTRWDPPGPELKGPHNTYQRLQHGWRNVVLAVVDQGVISYLQLSEAAFGEEKMYERFDRGSGQGTKRGRGGRGRGRGRGGRGRGT